jgi:hypothetical protein
VPGDRELRLRLAHVRWIGGGSGAGKSTVAAHLVAEDGLRLYDTDASIGPHVERSIPARQPLMQAFLAMGMDERWLDRSPAEMFATFHGFQGEGFDMIVDDLLALPAERPIVAEGFRLLPRLVAPLLSHSGQAVWLIPTQRFRRFALEARGSTAAMLAATRDPSLAFEKLLARDHLFTSQVAAEAAALGLETLEVDVGDTVEAVVASVRRALALGP